MRSLFENTVNNTIRPLPENILSLNLWKRKEQPEDIWVAGVFHRIDDQALLIGQGETLILENFSEDSLLEIDENITSQFTAQLLRPGDKVAVCNLSGPLRILVIRANSSTHQTTDPLKVLTFFKNSQHWENYLSQVRTFFIERGFAHITTPNLVLSTAMESALEPFQTDLNFLNFKKQVYLATSPEFHLKRAMADGLTEIFEITPCFRNNEKGFQHLPEFTMLEWYRSYGKLEQLIQDIQDLLVFLMPQEGQYTYKERSVRELFHDILGFDLTPDTTTKDLQALAKKLDLNFSTQDSWDDLFHLVFIAKIESHLGFEGIDYVYDYPKSQSALAKVNNNGWTDRFEMYWQGYEIANAFNELIDPGILKDRFLHEQQKKIKLGYKAIPPLDEHLIQAMTLGLPTSAGIALGLERLYMAINKSSQIENLKYFTSDFK